MATPLPTDVVELEWPHVRVKGVRVTVRAELPAAPADVAAVAELVRQVAAAVAPAPLLNVRMDDITTGPTGPVTFARVVGVAMGGGRDAPAQAPEVAAAPEAKAPPIAPPDLSRAGLAASPRFLLLPAGNRWGAPKRDALVAALRHAPRTFGIDDVVAGLAADGYADALEPAVRKTVLAMMRGVVEAGRAEVVTVGGPGVSSTWRLVGPKPSAPAAPPVQEAAPRAVRQPEQPSPAPGRPSADEVRRRLLERRRAERGDAGDDDRGDAGDDAMNGRRSREARRHAGARARNGSADFDAVPEGEPDDDDLPDGLDDDDESEG